MESYSKSSSTNIMENLIIEFQIMIIPLVFSPIPLNLLNQVPQRTTLNFFFQLFNLKGTIQLLQLDETKL